MLLWTPNKMLDIWFILAYNRFGSLLQGILMGPQTVFGITGPPRAGKGTVAKVLAAVFGKEHCATIESGAILEDILRKTGHPAPQSRSAQQELWVRKKDEGRDPEWLTKEVERRLSACGKEIWVFVGVRMPSDVALIQKYPHSLLFYVNAPFRRRLLFAQKAAEGKTGKTDERRISDKDFAKLHTKETEQFIASIGEMDGVVSIHNTGTFRALGAQIISALLTKRVINPAGIALRKEALDALYLKLESQ